MPRRDNQWLQSSVHEAGLQVSDNTNDGIRIIFPGFRDHQLPNTTILINIEGRTEDRLVTICPSRIPVQILSVN